MKKETPDIKLPKLTKEELRDRIADGVGQDFVTTTLNQ